MPVKDRIEFTRSVLKNFVAKFEATVNALCPIIAKPIERSSGARAPRRSDVLRRAIGLDEAGILSVKQMRWLGNFAARNKLR